MTNTYEARQRAYDSEAALQERRAHHDRLRAATRRVSAPCRCARCGEMLPRHAMSRLGTGKDTELVCIECLYPGGGN